jgi:putative salt-induced outer membrane protein
MQLHSSLADRFHFEGDAAIRRRLVGFLVVLTFSLFVPLTRGQNVNPPPPPPWTGSAAAGLSLTKGNSDTMLITLSARTGRKWDQNEISLGINGAYGENDGEENNKMASAFAQYNRLFTERWYGFGRVEGLYDGIAGVDYRFTASAGLGYYFIKKTNTTFSVEAGPGYVVERLRGISGTNTVIENNSYMTFRVGEKFEHKFNDRVRIWQTLEFLPQLDDVHNFIVNGEVGVESALTKSWSLRVVLQDTFDNEPAPGRENNDLKLIAGVGWKF